MQNYNLPVAFYLTEPVQQTNPADLFQWLPKEHMCVLVYLVSLVTGGCVGGVFEIGAIVFNKLLLKWNFALNIQYPPPTAKCC